MRAKSRRAQAAIEYLSTYAWAFLGLLVTVGALNYFGIFEPSNYTPERCDSGSQIACVDLYASTSDYTSRIYIMVKNNYPRDIVIENATIISIDPPLVANQENMLVKPAHSHTLVFNSHLPLFNAGNKQHLTYEITYRRFDPGGYTTSHTVIGTGIVEVAGGEHYTSPSLQEPYCGNGIIEAGEMCDPPTTIIVVGQEEVNRPSDDCSANAQCLSDCTCEETN